MNITIDSDIPQVVADLRTAEEKADAKLRAINTRGARELLKLARTLVHVRTGRLRDGLIVEGPFDIATGVLEARVSAPSVPYAEAEFDRGGEHDTPARTLEEGQDILDGIAQDMEAAIAQIMEGR